jgi:hypothetical protein
MRQIFSLLILLLVFISCTKDDKNEIREFGRENNKYRQSINELETDENPAGIAGNPNEEISFLEAEVIDDRVRLRDWQTLDSEILGYLNTGEQVKILQRGRKNKIETLEDYWYRVEMNDGKKGWVFGAYLGLKEPAGRFMLLEEYGMISMNDIEYAGIEKLTSIKQILDKLSEKQIKEIWALRIEESIIESFNGIERFTKLKQIRIKNSVMNNFIELVLPYSGEEGIWLFINNTQIENLKSLGNLQNIFLLSLDGCRIKNMEYTDFPKGLQYLSLNNFFEFRCLTEKIPETIHGIYLEDNGIKTINDIEFLRNYPELERIFIQGNEIPIEILEKEAVKWRPKRLVFLEGDDGSL